MGNSEYWRKRFLELEEGQHQEGEEYYRDLQKQFRTAQNSITMDIERWYQRMADNNGISLVSAKKLLKRNELEEFHWTVEQYIKAGEENAIDQRWMKQLENASAKYHISYLESMKLQMQQHCELLSAKYQGGMTDFLGKEYADGFYHTAFEVQKGYGVYTNLAELNTMDIDNILTKPWAVDGRNFSDRIWENKEKLVRELHNELTQCIMRGQDPQKAIDNIAKAMNVSKAQAGRLVMTELAAIRSMSRLDAYKKMGVEEYEVVATLDSLTSDICQDMDGRHFRVSDFEAGTTAPPFHPNCRSDTAPYFDENFGDIGERAARDEETGKTYFIPDDMKYQEWEDTFVKGGDKSGFDVLDDGSALHYSRQKEDSGGGLQGAPVNGRMEGANGKEGSAIAGMRSLGKIATSVLEKEFGKMLTDEIVVTDERIAHIRERHSIDYELFEQYGNVCVQNPDYVIKDGKNEATVFMVKKLPDTNLNVVSKLALETDEVKLKNSVITFYRIRERNLKKLIEKNKLLYKKE